MASFCFRALSRYRCLQQAPYPTNLRPRAHGHHVWAFLSHALPKQRSTADDLKIKPESENSEVKVTSTPVPFEEGDQDLDASAMQPTKWESFTDRWWAFELAGWFVSLLAVIAVVVLLYLRDGKPLPNWSKTIVNKGRTFHFSITINAVVSIFSTIFKTALLVPVAAALSQLKWTWFQEGHRLLDFQTFDAANSSPLGSLLLIWAFRGRTLACLGCLIIVVTLSLDFAFQQLLSYPSLPIAVSNATVVRSDNYEAFNAGLLNNVNVDSSMLAAIYTGIYDINNDFQVTPLCSTGNCTWQAPYTSLGVCSRCFDSTTNLIKSCGKYVPTGTTTLTQSVDYCDYSLPNGLSISGQPNILQGVALNISNSLTNTTHFQQMANPISVLSMLSGTWKGMPNPDAPDDGPVYIALSSVQATECALFYCVQKYEAEVINGKLTENLLFTYHDNAATYVPYNNFTLNPPLAFTNSTVPPTSNFYVLPGAARALQVEFQAVWSGNLTYNPVSYDEYPSNDVANFLYGLSLSNTQKMMRNLATSITNLIRSSGGAPKAAFGVASKDVPFAQVNWGWIAVPATLLVLTLVFLLATMSVTAKKGVTLWKGSSLAMFYHPLTSDGRAKLAKAQGPRQTEKIAGNLQVRWEQTSRGWRLISH